MSRALGGAALEGEKIVRLVYMDEAGISNLGHEPTVVVSAIVIDADKKLMAVERHLESLAIRHIAPEHHASFVFHATELFNGGGKVFDRHNPDYPLERRLRIADDLANIPRRFRLPIIFGFTKREQIIEAFDLPKDTPLEMQTRMAHGSAFMSCAVIVEQYMRRETNNEVCLLVVEDNPQARTLLRNSQSFYRDPRCLAQIDEEHKKLFPLRKIREDPLFQSKRPGSALIIADFCAYVFKRILMNDERYERFFAPMREQLGVSLEERA